MRRINRRYPGAKSHLGKPEAAGHGWTGGPFPSWVHGEPEDAYAASCVVDHGQDVGLGAVEQVGGEEVAGQDRLGLGAQEL